MTIVRLMAFSPATNTFLGFLPDYTNAQVSIVNSDVGALTFAYPLKGRNAALLQQPVDIAVQVPPSSASGQWAEPGNGRFMYLRDEKDGVATDGTLTAECPSYLVAWQKAVVPYASLDGDGRRTFTSQTIGAILGTLFTEAQARGAMSGLTWTFTSTLDSNITSWDAAHTLLTYSLDPGTDFLAVLADLRDKGYIEYRVDGRALSVYQMARATTYSKLVTGGNAQDQYANPGVILRVGRDLTEIPTKRSWENLMSAAIVAGDQGVSVTRTNGTTPWGRWETFVNASGTDDTTALSKAGDDVLADGSTAKVEKTFTLNLQGADPSQVKFLPGTAYYPGCYVGLVDADSPLPQRVRVQSLTITVDANGTDGGNVVLVDRFVEAVESKVSSLTKGTGSILFAGSGLQETNLPTKTFGGATVAGGFGGVPSTVAPGTTLATVTLPAGVLRASLTVTGYTTGPAPWVQVYFDGVYVGDCIMNTGTVTAAHMTLIPAVFTRTVTAGTHTVSVRLASGNFDAQDRFSFIGTVTPA